MHPWAKQNEKETIRERERMTLTIEQLAYYRDKGYLIVEGIMTLEECEELNRYAEEVVMGKVPLSGRDAVSMEPHPV